MFMSQCVELGSFLTFVTWQLNDRMAVVKERAINPFLLQGTRDATMEKLLETVFYIGSDPRLYSQSIQLVESCVGEIASERGVCESERQESHSPVEQE
jgi:hypothetical protein